MFTMSTNSQTSPERARSKGYMGQICECASVGISWDFDLLRSPFLRSLGSKNLFFYLQIGRMRNMG